MCSIRLHLGMWEVVCDGCVVDKFYSQAYADRRLREILENIEAGTYLP